MHALRRSSIDSRLPGPHPSRPALGFLRVALAAVLAVVLVCALGAAVAHGQPWPERRRDQYPTEPGYLFVPAPYSLPGIGQGIAWVAYMANIGETHTEGYFYGLTGDAEGFGIGFNELHVVPRRLLLELYTERISRVQIFQYESRGMDTDKNDYQIVDVRDTDFRGGLLFLTFDERRFEGFAGLETGEYDIVAFRDRNGRLLQKLDDPVRNEERFYTAGVRLDLTDDLYDPRRGVRAIVMAETAVPQSSSAPDFYRLNSQLDVFIPIGKQSTWAFDFYRSGAVVQSEGETDPAVLIRDVCPVPDPACETSEPARDYVTNQAAANRNGTSTSLGGRSRLQAYPDGRFQGAYTAYVGTELRLNLTDEITPFDYLIWKDVRTAIQLALIAETGTVAETEAGLWERSRSDYGFGLRMLMAGGGVYRADYVTGDEGPQLTIIVNYPW